MSFDEGFKKRFEQAHEGKKHPISDNYVQIQLMKYVFEQEQLAVPPERRVANPTKIDIFNRWHEKHAKNWGHVIETHETDEVDTADPAWLARCYELLKNDEAGPTVH